jgi:hypothetical protein
MHTGALYVDALLGRKPVRSGWMNAKSGFPNRVVTPAHVPSPCDLP